MKYLEIADFISQCAQHNSENVRWVDDSSFSEENMYGAAPGGFLNPFGYFVIGTTIGGNAIVVGEDDPRVTFADHTWYDDNEISYEDIAGDGEWITLPLSKENVHRSLYVLAVDRSQFMLSLASGAVDQTLDSID